MIESVCLKSVRRMDIKMTLIYETWGSLGALSTPYIDYAMPWLPYGCSAVPSTASAGAFLWFQHCRKELIKSVVVQKCFLGISLHIWVVMLLLGTDFYGRWIHFLQIAETVANWYLSCTDSKQLVLFIGYMNVK